MKANEVKNKLSFCIRNLLLHDSDQFFKLLASIDIDFLNTSIYQNKNTYTINEISELIANYLLNKESTLKKFLNSSFKIYPERLNYNDDVFADYVASIIDRYHTPTLRSSDSAFSISLQSLTGLGELFGETTTTTTTTTQEKKTANIFAMLIVFAIIIVVIYLIYKYFAK